MPSIRRAAKPPLSVPPQRSCQLKELCAIQIGHHPVCRLRAVPVKDLVTLFTFLPNGVEGRVTIGPHEDIDVVHSALVDQRSDRPPIHVVESPANESPAQIR